MLRNLTTRRGTSRRRPEALLLFGACMLSAVSIQAEEVILRNGAAADGYTLLIGDKKNWSTVVGSEPTGSAAGYLITEPDTAEGEGAVNARWNGKGEAQLYLALDSPKDFTDYLEQNGALVLLIKVITPPKKEVLIRMGCGYPCAANADIGKLLKALPAEQWLKVSFDLACFAGSGLNIKTVDTPLLLLTRGKFAVSISDASIVTGLGKDATVKCQ